MSDNNQQAGMFDSAMLKSMRDASMENWAKFMTQFVNTDAYAGTTGAMLDATLSASAPFRKAMESVTAQSLANLNLPSRDDIARLANQLINIEMRLDDMDAKLDQLAPSQQGSS